MLAPRAADGDREIASIILREARSPVEHELRNVTQKRLNLRDFIKKFLNLRVTARLIAKGWLPVRIRKTARIKGEIGIYRHAIFVAKRHAANGHALLTSRAHPLTDEVSELMDIRVACIDDQVGATGHWNQ